jgi:hypothetical protein
MFASSFRTLITFENLSEVAIESLQERDEKGEAKGEHHDNCLHQAYQHVLTRPERVG